MKMKKEKIIFSSFCDIPVFFKQTKLTYMMKKRSLYNEAAQWKFTEQEEGKILYLVD